MDACLCQSSVWYLALIDGHALGSWHCLIDCHSPRHSTSNLPQRVCAPLGPGNGKTMFGDAGSRADDCVWLLCALSPDPLFPEICSWTWRLYSIGTRNCSWHHDFAIRRFSK